MLETIIRSFQGINRTVMPWFGDHVGCLQSHDFGTTLT